MTADATLTKLGELLAAIQTYDDPRRASAEWKQVYRLLQQTSLESRDYQGVVGMRDLGALAQLIEKLAVPAPAAPEHAFDEATLRHALQAFKRRAKLTRLDDESTLGRSPLTKGANSALGAITPPTEIPDDVWQELVRQHRLRYLGHGLYELPKH